MEKCWISFTLGAGDCLYSVQYQRHELIFHNKISIYDNVVIFSDFCEKKGIILSTDLIIKQLIKNNFCVQNGLIGPISIDGYGPQGAGVPRREPQVLDNGSRDRG